MHDTELKRMRELIRTRPTGKLVIITVFRE